MSLLLFVIRKLFKFKIVTFSFHVFISFFFHVDIEYLVQFYIRCSRKKQNSISWGQLGCLPSTKPCLPKQTQNLKLGQFRKKSVSLFNQLITFVDQLWVLAFTHFYWIISIAHYFLNKNLQRPGRCYDITKYRSGGDNGSGCQDRDSISGGLSSLSETESSGNEDSQLNLKSQTFLTITRKSSTFTNSYTQKRGILMQSTLKKATN